MIIICPKRFRYPLNSSGKLSVLQYRLKQTVYWHSDAKASLRTMAFFIQAKNKFQNTTVYMSQTNWCS